MGILKISHKIAKYFIYILFQSKPVAKGNTNLEIYK